MRFTYLALALCSLPLFAQESVSFRNDREGVSFYAGGNYSRSIEDVKRDFEPSELSESYRKALRSSPKLCVYDINQKLRSDLYRKNPRFKNFEGVVYFLREQNEIDDVVVRILLKAHKVVTTDVFVKDDSKLSSPGEAKNLKANTDLVKGFDKRLQSGLCFDQAYQALFGDLRKTDKKFNGKNLEALLVQLRGRRVISESLFVKLEQARINELESSGLNLKDYSQKLKVLRTQFPLRDQKERSDFVASKADKVKMSYRQRLFENYSEVQIALMADMIRNLRRRLESNKIEIVVHNSDSSLENYVLEPMERFRFSIKKLRTEMKKLTLNSQFAHRQPDYMDLIAASYEVSFIAGSELQQLAGLEDVWNPQKTFWDKAKVWFTTFSTVSSLVIPPPYGFVPTLVLVVIQATVEKDAPNPEDNGSIF